MENFILVYFAKSAVALALFYLLYLLLFRRDTLFVAKRIYLIVSLVLSGFIPFVIIHFSRGLAPRIPTACLSEVVVSSLANLGKSEVSVVDWQSALVLILLAVSLVFLVRFGLQLFEIFRLKYRFLSQKMDGFTLILISDGQISPFSFFSWIFTGANPCLQDAEDGILRHEMVHAKQWHSLDVILSELFCIVFWWNPIAWICRREIRLNHEFLADRGVLNVGYNPQKYQYLLLHTLALTNRIPINNHFNISQLKERIAMMNKKQSSWHEASKYLLALPLAGLLIAGNAVQASSLKVAIDELKSKEMASENVNSNSLQNSVFQKQEGAKTVTVNEKGDNASKKGPGFGVKNDKGVYTAVDQMPQFPQGERALMDFLAKNLKYPKEDARKGIQGRVVVRFVVQKDGRISDVVVMKGISPACDKEAIRVVSMMPQWKPGKHHGEKVDVYYTLPILYKLK